MGDDTYWWWWHHHNDDDYSGDSSYLQVRMVAVDWDVDCCSGTTMREQMVSMNLH